MTEWRCLVYYSRLGQPVEAIQHINHLHKVNVSISDINIVCKQKPTQRPTNEASTLFIHNELFWIGDALAGTVTTHESLICCWWKCDYVTHPREVADTWMWKYPERARARARCCSVVLYTVCVCRFLSLRNMYKSNATMIVTESTFCSYHTSYTLFFLCTCARACMCYI